MAGKKTEDKTESKTDTKAESKPVAIKGALFVSRYPNLRVCVGDRPAGKMKTQQVVQFDRGSYQTEDAKLAEKLRTADGFGRDFDEVKTA